MAKNNKFGTFGGVFTPSILTILGVIMYLRLPMIIGQAGLMATIGIIIVAHIISATTGLSVSSIATDKKVQAGGTYYMISRSLGLPIGGTLGLALFVGLSFSVSLYLIGFAESFLGYWNFEVTKQNIQICGSIILFTVTVITFISTSLAIKTQYVIMTAIGLSLLSIFIGHNQEIPIPTDVVKSNYEVPLMVLFGIFFPAVTGFEAGVSMSGDLKDPKKSIPLGAILAIVVGLVVYILLTLFLSKTVNHDLLAYDSEVLLKIAWIPQLVVAGIWGATLSSALGSILGAPRILQATAVDKITHKFFAKGTGEANEPRNALLLTFLIAEAGILIGELDVIARIVSIFFITTYGFLNISCAFESLTSADFRPSFKAPAWVSIIGALACILVMIQLDFVAMVAAIIVLGLVFYYIRRKELALQGGDAWGSFWASVIKSGLKRVKDPNLESRNWRPNVIMFSGDEKARPELIEFGKSIVGRLGILSAFDLIETSEELLLRQDAFSPPDKDGFSIQKHKCRSVYEGMDEIVRAYGFLSLQPNTIFMGLSNKERTRESFLNFVHRLDKNNFNSVFMSYNDEKGFGKHDSIDVYWRGDGNNITLVINLLRHLTASSLWEDAHIRLLLISEDTTHAESMYKGAEAILDKYRTYMQIVVINNSIEKLERVEIIQRESANTSLTVVGFSDDIFDNFRETYPILDKVRQRMGAMIFVNASRTFEYHNILPKATVNLAELGNQEGKAAPELQLTIFPDLNNLITQLDATAHTHFTDFLAQTRVCHVERLNGVIEELEKLQEFCTKSRDKWQDQNSAIRRKKAQDKLRGEYLFKTKKIIEQLIEEPLENDKDLLQTAISRLLTQLNSLTASVNGHQTVQVEKALFAASATDKASIRMYKWRKRMASSLTGGKITIDVPTRNLARYFVFEKRLSALVHQLNQWHHHFLVSLNAIKQLREKILEAIVLPPQLSAQQLTRVQQELKKDLESIRQKIIENEKGLHTYLLVDTRQEINLMVADMLKLSPTAALKGKKRPPSFYKHQAKLLEGFGTDMYESIQLYLNKSVAEIWVSDLQYRISVAAEDHQLAVYSQVNSALIQPLKKALNLLVADKENADNAAKIMAELPEVAFSGSFEESFEEMTNEVLNFTQQLPDAVRIADFAITQTGQTSFGETLNLPLRRMAQYSIESGFTEQMKKIDKELIHFLREKAVASTELLSRLEFEVENVTVKNKNATLRDIQILESTRQQLSNNLAQIQKASDALSSTIKKAISEAFEPLSPYKIAATAKAMSHFIREYQGRQTLKQVGSSKDKVARYLYNQWVRLLYKQSEGVLLARQLSGEKTQLSAQEFILQQITQVMIKPQVLQKVPAYYQNLFSGSSSIVDDFWINRENEQARFNALLQQYRSGYLGAIMVVGNKNSGKTAFSRYMAQQHFKSEHIHFILPPLHGSRNADVLEGVVNKVLANNEEQSPWAALPKGSVLIFNDVELWWENSSDGTEALRRLAQWIDQYSGQHLFILNTSSYALRAINQHIDLSPYILGTVDCLPFGAEEIKDLILSRHRSSGMAFSLGKNRSGAISDIRLASLFNKFFIHSGGNPGLSLYSWLAAIHKVSGNQLSLHPPRPISQSVFDRLSADWVVVLSQIILHKRMDRYKLKRVLHMQETEIDEVLRSLLMAGLINERNTGLYTINPAITHWLAHYLRNKNCI